MDRPTVQQADTIARVAVERLAACLDLPLDGIASDTLPPLWHWLFFLDAASASALGRDGGLPGRDPALPARMWAGGRIRFLQPVPIGAVASRASTVLDVKEREGTNGRLRFVTVRHHIRSTSDLLIEEEQDIVQLAPVATRTQNVAPAPEAPPHAMVREITPDEIMLFRFSALTFNAHRIHYDEPFATKIEHYPGLVVHGPLQAILLALHLGQAAEGRLMTGFDFRARAPAFCGRPLRLEAWRDGPENWHAQSRDASGFICMTAKARFTNTMEDRQ
jgi:3-methylfumaryl-CoA hydratase